VKPVALPQGAVQFVASGGRDVDVAKLTLDVTMGEHVRVTDTNGDEIGIAIADPENQRLRVMAVLDDGFPKIDGALIGWRVERALRWRQQLGLVGPTNAYRIVHGAGDGLPGFTCDVLGSTAVVYAYGEGLKAVGRQVAEAIVGFAKLDGAVVKVRARGGASEVVQELVGKPPAESMLVTEHDVPFEVHPLGGLNHGLFTDMREQRRGLGRFAAGYARAAAGLGTVRGGQARAQLVLVYRCAERDVRARGGGERDKRRYECGRAGVGARKFRPLGLWQ
jgi:23S rRNA G2069 N7-methylase RlmK/C1962 C5-methylase RlmI